MTRPLDASVPPLDAEYDLRSAFPDYVHYFEDWAVRSRGARRIVVASYLLADGLFQDRLRNSGADAVTEPLGGHPATVRLIASRFRRARLPIAA